MTQPLVPVSPAVTIPAYVASCPDCGGSLSCRILSWKQEDGAWVADSIELECSKTHPQNDAMTPQATRALFWLQTIEPRLRSNRP